MKLRKVRGRSSSPNGRAVLHQVAVESSVRGQELRCAKEGLFMWEEAESVTGLGGQVRNAAFPRKIMANSETQKLE